MENHVGALRDARTGGGIPRQRSGLRACGTADCRCWCISWTELCKDNETDEFFRNSPAIHHIIKTRQYKGVRYVQFDATEPLHLYFKALSSYQNCSFIAARSRCRWPGEAGRASRNRCMNLATVDDCSPSMVPIQPLVFGSRTGGRRNDAC